jgi:hypothetical protein
MSRRRRLPGGRHGHGDQPPDREDGRRDARPVGHLEDMISRFRPDG